MVYGGVDLEVVAYSGLGSTGRNSFSAGRLEDTMVISKFYFHMYKKMYSQNFGLLHRASQMQHEHSYDTWCYFIGNRHHRILKVGISKSPQGRIRDLQVGCPYELYVFGMIPGDEVVETMLHRALAPFALRGEWFRLNRAISYYIDLASIECENLECAHLRGSFRSSETLPGLESVYIPRDEWDEIVEHSYPNETSAAS